ncbi:MAG: HAMP domain-containing histidine kinase [Candidatus Obscuribacterales bacterium]|nr:HAMP domain-containing histidine kinase [Candidatus Obscuribacterales bacterium]
MTFFQRVIILLSTPILAQFIFVLVLLGVYRTVEEITYKDLEYRNQTAEIMNISILCYKATGLLATYAFTQNEKLLPAFDQINDKLSRKTENLSILATKDSSRSLTETRLNLTKTLKHLNEMRELLNVKARQFNNKALLAGELHKDLESSLSSLDQLIAERSRAGASDSKDIEKSHWLIITAVLGGFAANMLMSAILLAVFAKDFASRFSVIIDNTSRLSQGQELNEAIVGKDELANLDRVFHDMNRSLKETEERKEQLVSMVSHDLRNPLTALSISLDSMTMGQFGDLEKGLELRINNSRRVVKRLSMLVNDILDMEKLRSGKLNLTLTLVDMQEVVNDSISELESIAAVANVDIKSNLEGVLVVADRERITQIIINLLGNALKFSPKGSEIKISAEPEGDFTRIKIRDQGPGVPESYRESIFLPFEQVPDDKRPKKGSTGLGLPICKMLVELHGGKIGVSGEEQGSSFWFTLRSAELEAI